MLKKFYLIDENKNKIYVEHYTLNKNNSKKKNGKKKKDKKKIVILLHGFLEHSNMKKYNELTALLLDENFEVLKFDFTGHGKSKGIVKVKNFYSNIIRIYKYISEQNVSKQKNKVYEDINIIAYSISGIVTLNFLKFLECKNKSKKYDFYYKNFVKKVIFLNPYFGFSKSKIESKIKSFFSKMYVKIFGYIKLYNKKEGMIVKIDKDFFENRRILEEEFKTKKVFDIRTNTKIFIIHGKYDKNVPLKSSETAYKELSKKGNFVLLYVVEDDHFFSKNKSLVYKKILHFLKV